MSPKSYTRHPTPCLPPGANAEQRHLDHETLNPKPHTLNPKPYTLHPTYTLHPACHQVPTPSSDIWIMDIARKESEGVSDKMAEFDGDDDMLQVPQKSPNKEP